MYNLEITVEYPNALYPIDNCTFASFAGAFEHIRKQKQKSYFIISANGRTEFAETIQGECYEGTLEANDFIRLKPIDERIIGELDLRDRIYDENYEEV